MTPTATIQRQLAVSKRTALGGGTNVAEGTARKKAVIVAARNQVTIAADGRTLASKTPTINRRKTMNQRAIIVQFVEQ
jgi:hypothetical protein